MTERKKRVSKKEFIEKVKADLENKETPEVVIAEPVITEKVKKIETKKITVKALHRKGILNLGKQPDGNLLYFMPGEIKTIEASEAVDVALRDKFLEIVE